MGASTAFANILVFSAMAAFVIFFAWGTNALLCWWERLAIKEAEESLREHQKNVQAQAQGVGKNQGGWVSGELVLWLWGIGAVLFLIGWLREMRYPPPPIMQTLLTIAASVIFLATAAVGSILWGLVQLLRSMV